MLTECPKCKSPKIFIGYKDKKYITGLTKLVPWAISIKFKEKNFRQKGKWRAICYNIDCDQKYWLYPDGRITKRSK